MSDLRSIAGMFGVSGVSSVTEVDSGHINKTCLVDCGGERYILQSVNSEIFRDPKAVMNNIRLIGEAFGRCLEYWVDIPEFLSCGGENYAEVEDVIWRMYPYIEADSPVDDRRHGYAVGRFMSVVNSCGFELADTLPRLHDFRLEGVPRRNIHGDTKGDNIIHGRFCSTVIDLDTAKPGYACADYGDMIRSIIRITGDELELWRIEEATTGFAEGLDGLLTPAEVESLYGGILLVTDELRERYIGDSEGRSRNFPNKTREQCAGRADELRVQRELIVRSEEQIREIIGRAFK